VDSSKLPAGPIPPSKKVVCNYLSGGPGENWEFPLNFFSIGAGCVSMGIYGFQILQFSLRFVDVLLPLLLLMGAALSVKRLFFFHRLLLGSELLRDGLKNLVVEGRTIEAIVLCEQTPGSLARVLKQLLLGKKGEGAPAGKKQMELEVQLWEQHMASIAFLAKLLPLLGCLGTSLALAIGFSPSGQAAAYPSVTAFASAYGHALAAAIIGLSGGVFLQLSYHFLYGRLAEASRKLNSDVEEFSSLLSHPYEEIFPWPANGN
jgi:biopolymer transport protein ExbB/TolQ